MEYINIFVQLVVLWVAILITKKFILKRLIRSLKKMKIKKDMRKLLFKLIKNILIIFGFVLSLSILGLKEIFMSTLTFGGMMGLGITMGLRNWVSALVAGIMLIKNKDFNVGDKVIIQNKKYEVLDITTIYTKLKGKEGILCMPNARITKVFGWTKVKK